VPELIILVVEIAPVAGVLRIGRVDRRDSTRKLQRVERANQVFTDADALISLREGVDPVCIADRYADAAVRLARSEQIIGARIEVLLVRLAAGDRVDVRPVLVQSIIWLLEPATYV
jgi:hypothetical protein